MATFDGKLAPPSMPIVKPDGSPTIEFALFLKNLKTYLSPAAGGVVIPNEYISGIIKAPIASDYRIIESIPYGAQLVSLTGKLSAGTLTAALKIGAVAVTGGSLNATTVQGAVNPSALNEMVAADTLVLALSAIAAATDFSFTVAYKR